MDPPRNGLSASLRKIPNSNLIVLLLSLRVRIRQNIDSNAACIKSEEWGNGVIGIVVTIDCCVAIVSLVGHDTALVSAT